VRLAIVVLGLALGSPAYAFQIESSVTSSCHEDITTDAVARSGFPGTDAPAPTEDQRRAFEDLTFTLPRRDVWMMALLIGVRSNDIRDEAPSDLAGLVGIHNDPADQPAHCMRKRDDNGAGGDLTALATCRAFVLGELEAAGLLGDTLDLVSSEPVSVYLAFRGRTTLELPRFAYRLGRAIHAIEDGYTHTFRDPDSGAVTHVLNWVDFVRDGYDEDDDGHPHISALDDCRRDDPPMTRRIARTTDAVAALLAAIADPSPGRRTRVEAAIDGALAHVAGCDARNRYCDAEELEERPRGCSIVGQPAVLVVLVWFALGRRRRRRRPLVVALVIGLGLVAPVQAETLRWHVDTRLGAALDRAGAATTTGIAVDYERLTFGVVAEWNPWFSLDTRETRAGALNAYVTLARTWYRSPTLALYSRAEFGTSTLLFELVGVDRYNTGVYVGGSLLGVRIPLRHCVELTLDPSHFAMPTPQLVGLPFYYLQYRVSVGVEFHLQ
jgi:hypothetical protein